jgi:hypothetical protein
MTASDVIGEQFGGRSCKLGIVAALEHEGRAKTLTTHSSPAVAKALLLSHPHDLMVRLCGNSKVFFCEELLLGSHPTTVLPQQATTGSGRCITVIFLQPSYNIYRSLGVPLHHFSNLAKHTMLTNHS